MAAANAKDILRQSLKQYGLDGLTDTVWGLITSEVLPENAGPDQIGFALQDTKEFQDRFPANAQRVKAGLPPLTVSEYVGLERQYKNAMAGSGLPAGFYDDPTDFANFIARDVSPAEVQTRVNEGFRAVSEASPQVVAQMKELYGVDEGGLAAYFLDPDRATPILQRQARAAQIATEGLRQAGIQLTATAAEGLSRELGTDAQGQAAAGFRQLAQQQGLATPIMAGEEAISQEEQIGAAFGTNEAARQRIETRRRRRQAEFEAGGGFAAGQAGMAGLRTV